jgi:hypothetical protein
MLNWKLFDNYEPDDCDTQFVCRCCWQTFTSEDEKNKHEQKCITYGESKLPRPRDLSEWHK